MAEEKEDWRMLPCKGNIPQLSLFAAPLEENVTLIAACDGVLDLTKHEFHNMRLYASTLHPTLKIPTNAVFFLETKEKKGARVFLYERKTSLSFRPVKNIPKEIQAKSWKYKNKALSRKSEDRKWNDGFECGHLFGRLFLNNNHGHLSLTHGGVNLVGQTKEMNQNEFEEIEKKVGTIRKEFGRVLGNFSSVFANPEEIRRLPDDKDTGVADAFGAIVFYEKEGLPAISGFLTRKINDINQTKEHVVAADLLSKECGRVGDTLDVDPFMLNQLNAEFRIPILLTRGSFGFINGVRNKDYDKSIRASLFKNLKVATTLEVPTPHNLTDFRKAVQFMRKAELWLYFAGGKTSAPCLICTKTLQKSELVWTVGAYVPSWSTQVLAFPTIHYNCLREIQEECNFFMTSRVIPDGTNKKLMLRDHIENAKRDFPTIPYYKVGTTPDNKPGQILASKVCEVAGTSKRPQSASNEQNLEANKENPKKMKVAKIEETPPQNKALRQTTLTQLFSIKR